MKHCTYGYAPAAGLPTEGHPPFQGQTAERLSARNCGTRVGDLRGIGVGAEEQEQILEAILQVAAVKSTISSTDLCVHYDA